MRSSRQLHTSLTQQSLEYRIRYRGRTHAPLSHHVRVVQTVVLIVRASSADVVLGDVPVHRADERQAVVSSEGITNMESLVKRCVQWKHVNGGSFSESVNRILESLPWQGFNVVLFNFAPFI